MSMLSKVAGVLCLAAAAVLVLLGLGAMGERSALLADQMFGGAFSAFVAGVVLLAFSAHLEHLEAIRRAVERTFGAQAGTGIVAAGESKPVSNPDFIL